MTFKITRDESIDVTLIVFDGVVDHDHLLEGVRAARDTPGHNYRTLMTVSADVTLDLSSDDLRSIALALRSERADDAPRGLTAIVAPTTLAYGLARMVQVFMEEGPADVRVFQSQSDAITWLID
jgi:hypothetical protein